MLSELICQGMHHSCHGSSGHASSLSQGWKIGTDPIPLSVVNYGIC